MSVMDIGKWVLIGVSVVVTILIALFTALILGGLFAHWLYDVFMFGWRML
jgi:hypothetical protein